MRTVVHAAGRLAHGMCCSRAFRSIGQTAESGRVGHVGARIQVRAVLIRGAQPLTNKLDSAERHGVVKRLMIVAGVALDAVGKGVHTGGGGYSGREAQGEAWIEQGYVSPNQGRSTD